VKLRFLFSIFRPFASIARELRILRELYELDLGSRNPPLYRLTEKASKKDTEVSYSGVVDDRPMYKRWFEQGDEEEEEG
jgi:hypothetical protein